MLLFDGWYASLENLKAIRGYEWHWLTRLKGNRLVNPDDTGNVPIETLSIPAEGWVVHLKGYGFVRVFRTVAADGDAEPGCPQLAYAALSIAWVVIHADDGGSLRMHDCSFSMVV